MTTSKEDPNSSPAPSPQPHVLIIGAGITGLVMGQALKQHGIPFTIFERDPNVTARGRGWGLTIHWSLETLKSLLPHHLVERLPEVYVNPEASRRGEIGNGPIFDLCTGEETWRLGPGQRVRVSRERLRALLLEGLDVQWSKHLISFTAASATEITASFSDSTSATGTLLVGADGAHSRVRSELLKRTPHLSRNEEVPVQFIGITAIFPATLAHKMLVLDPFFCQGSDSEYNFYLWFSFLSTPGDDQHTQNLDSYECQIAFSWPFRQDSMPVTKAEKVVFMKTQAEHWAEPFRECVLSIPDEADARSLNLDDWVPRKGLWDNGQGRVTMVGDAAHAMTMFRGDAANHGIKDVSVLLSEILPIFDISPNNAPSLAAPKTLKDAVDAYEDEMIRRGAIAVAASRQACLDAHLSRVPDESPLLTRRFTLLQS